MLKTRVKSYNLPRIRRQAIIRDIKLINEKIKKLYLNVELSVIDKFNWYSLEHRKYTLYKELFTIYKNKNDEKK